MSGSVDKSSNALSKLKADLNLIDVWRSCNPDQKQFSFIDPTRKGRDSRIDLWLIPKSVILNIICCKMTQAPAPDHKAVIMDIRICDRTRGKGYWKMNNSVINEEDYKDGITKLYKDAINEYGEHVPSMLIWEYLKVKIKRFTIHYCIVKATSRKNEIKDLERKLDS